MIIMYRLGVSPAVAYERLVHLARSNGGRVEGNEREGAVLADLGGKTLSAQYTLFEDELRIAIPDLPKWVPKKVVKAQLDRLVAPLLER